MDNYVLNLKEFLYENESSINDKKEIMWARSVVNKDIRPERYGMTITRGYTNWVTEPDTWGSFSSIYYKPSKNKGRDIFSEYQGDGLLQVNNSNCIIIEMQMRGYNSWDNFYWSHSSNEVSDKIGELTKAILERPDIMVLPIATNILTGVYEVTWDDDTFDVEYRYDIYKIYTNKLDYLEACKALKIDPKK